MSNAITCHASLISFCGRITDFLDKENALGLIFMDFSEAFDIAPHGKLSGKVEAVEISRKPGRLIRNEPQVGMKTDCINREDIVLEGGYQEHSPKTGPDTILCNIPGNGLGEEGRAN